MEWPGTNVLQIHVLVDPFLAFGGPNSHRPSIFPTQETVSVAAGRATRRPLSPARKCASGSEEEKIWGETEALECLGKVGRGFSG